VVGYITQKDTATAGAALGLSGIATGDPDNQMRAMAASINARGGFLGHRIVLVSHDVRTSEATSNPAQAAAAACAALVEKKAAIVVNPGSNPDLLACLKKNGIIVVGSTAVASGSSAFAPGLPGIYAPSAMSVDRYLPAVVDRLHAQGFFSRWDVRTGGPGVAPVKIGVQQFDNAAGRHYVAVLDKALRRYGLKIDEKDLHSTDIGQNASATSAAVLRFSANGVTHMFSANVLFYKGADSQGYKPRYAIDDTVPTPALLAQNVGKSQLHGAMGAGYLPIYEVPTPQDVSPSARRCRELMRKAGENLSQSLTVAYVLHVCDAMNFLERGFAAGGAVSAVGLQQGLSRMGRFESSLTYRSSPTPGHHDGAAAVRDFVYDDDCGCFAFVSTQIHPVP
jgi:ABC-type branched-subunit amino acid transport system substrate-binding protein